MSITTNHYLILAVALFGIGTIGAIARRNLFIMLMSMELMLSAGNLVFVTYATLFQEPTGQIAVLFSIAIAAAEISVGLAIVIVLYRLKGSIDPGVFRNLKG
jgi:NADH-quinone oxidoreductase subunit K